MSKTYRSLFLVCDSCKLAVDSDTKCCKHCGRPIWLKDAEKITKPVPAPIDEPVEEISNREKIIAALQKKLPVIFPENYCVAPNPMPKLNIFAEYIKKNHISEKDMDILGYGYDTNTKTHFFFGVWSMLYITQDIGGISVSMLYRDIKEVEESAERLTINNSRVVAVAQKRALAELLGSLTKAKVTMHNGSGTAISNGNNGGSPAPKTQYTVNDYIRDKKGFFMKLIMFAAKISLGAQCVVSFSCGAVLVGILFAVFALWINYHHPIIMLSYMACFGLVLENPDIGTGTEQGEWYAIAGCLILLALLFRLIMGLCYDRYMAKSKTQ